MALDEGQKSSKTTLAEELKSYTDYLCTYVSLPNDSGDEILNHYLKVSCRDKPTF